MKWFVSSTICQAVARDSHPVASTSVRSAISCGVWPKRTVDPACRLRYQWHLKEKPTVAGPSHCNVSLQRGEVIMTVMHSGSSKAYAEGWAAIFGDQKKATKKGASKKKSAAKKTSAKKSPGKKKTAAKKKKASTKTKTKAKAAASPKKKAAQPKAKKKSSAKRSAASTKKKK